MLESRADGLADRGIGRARAVVEQYLRHANTLLHYKEWGRTEAALDRPERLEAGKHIVSDTYVFTAPRWLAL